jgi:hypothetical protein
MIAPRQARLVEQPVVPSPMLTGPAPRIAAGVA